MSAERIELGTSFPPHVHMVTVPEPTGNGTWAIASVPGRLLPGENSCRSIGRRKRRSEGCQYLHRCSHDEAGLWRRAG
jgi:hypothetical protein